MRGLVVSGLAMALALAGTSCSSGGPAAVDQDRLEAADADVDNWLSYGRTYSEQRFSPLTDVNAGNVKDLGLAWAVELDTARGQEATPIVVDGVMYVSTAWSKVMALDAVSGKVLWTFDPEADGAQASHACCDFVNRGVAVWEGRVYVGTIDGRLVALDAKTGAKAWDVLTIDKSKPYTITMAPRVVRGKVIIGNSGAEMGVRGYVSAYDATSGKLVWRFYTVPGDPAKGPDGAASDEAIERIARPTWFGNRYWQLGGGGTVWDSVVYDAELNQLLVGVGNGSPWNQKIRSEGKGDNLFLASILALDPDTGKYKWHYQVNPGETWDYTATQQIMLADLTIAGKKRKVLMQAPKNGFFYVIDRQTGKLVSAQPFVNVNWASHIDLASGRPVENPGMRFEGKSTLLVPSGLGGHSWMPMSYSPLTGLVYIPAQENAAGLHDTAPFTVRPGRWNTGVDFGGPPPGMQPPKVDAPGKLLAWDPVAQKARWSVPRASMANGGTLATAGNLVFQGTGPGTFEAYSADKGTKLWTFPVGRSIMAAPITYRVNGQQYVAVMSGYGGAVGVASPGALPGRTPPGVIMAFKIGGKAVLPPLPDPTPPAPSPGEDQFTPAQVAQGGALFGQLCAICHGGPVNPSLPRSPMIAQRDSFHQVVIGGAFQTNGMPSFRAYLNDAEAESIRAFLVSEARKLK